MSVQNVVFHGRDPARYQRMELATSLFPNPIKEEEEEKKRVPLTQQPLDVEVKRAPLTQQPLLDVEVASANINHGTRVLVKRLDSFKLTRNWSRRSIYCPGETRRAMRAIRHWNTSGTWKKKGKKSHTRKAFVSRLPSKKTMCLLAVLLVVVGFMVREASHHHTMGTEKAKVDVQDNCPPESESLWEGGVRLWNTLTWYKLSARNAPDLSTCKSAMAKIQADEVHTTPGLESYWHALFMFVDVPLKKFIELVYGLCTHLFRIIGEDINTMTTNFVKATVPIGLFQLALYQFGVSTDKFWIPKMIVKIGCCAYSYGPGVMTAAVSYLSVAGSVATPSPLN